MQCKRSVDTVERGRDEGWHAVCWREVSATNNNWIVHTNRESFEFRSSTFKSWLRGSLVASSLVVVLMGAAPGATSAATIPAQKAAAERAATEPTARSGPPVARLTASADSVETERLAAHIAQKWKVPAPTAQRVVKAAYEQAPKQKISPTLVLAIVAQESGFRPTAQSNRGAQGLMQVRASDHPDKLKGKERRALLEPETNIEVGTQVLAEYLNDHGGRLDAALKAYSGNATAFPRKVRAAWQEFEQVRAA